MTIAILLQSCAASGVELYLMGEEIKLRGTKDAVARVAPMLRPYKSALLAHLRQQGAIHAPRAQLGVAGRDDHRYGNNPAMDTGAQAVQGKVSEVTPLTPSEVQHCQTVIADAIAFLQPHVGWSDEQCSHIVGITRRQPAYTLPGDAAALTQWVDAVKARIAAEAAIERVKGCCAVCANRTDAITVLGSGCAVARLQPLAPWRAWLDAEDEPNDCTHFERKT